MRESGQIFRRETVQTSGRSIGFRQECFPGPSVWFVSEVLDCSLVRFVRHSSILLSHVLFRRSSSELLLRKREFEQTHNLEYILPIFES
jgi:hypothetical protein